MKTVFLKDGTSILDVYKIEFSSKNVWIYSHTASKVIVLEFGEIDYIQ